MSFIKNNLLIFSVGLLSVVAFIVGAWLAFSQAGKVGQAQRELSRIEGQLASLMQQEPALTEENRAAAEQNLAELRDAMSRMRADLQKGAALNTSEDGISVIAGIQQYISRFQRLADAHNNTDGDPAPIRTPKDFAFGFDRYLNQAPVPERTETIALLDKQRQILNYLLTQLLASDPQSIESVRRELLELPDNETGGQSFVIDPAISARRPGAIDTLAFSITFTSYTDSLRDYLNRLAQFDLPIVVRDIQVKRPSGSKAAVAPTSPQNAASMFSIFDEDDAAADGQSTPEGPKPVIEENISQFTIILEFIEVVLPDLQTQDVS